MTNPTETANPPTGPAVDFINGVDTFFNTAGAEGFTGTDEILDAYLNAALGGTVSNVSYTGADGAGYFIDEYSVGPISGQNAILLSSGDLPNDTNTSTSYGVSNNTSGDADLTAAVQAAFPGAGETYDASIIEFTITIDDADIDGVSFDLVFGSDEYPEFSDTLFADIAAVFVNGTNVALFDEDPANPLSIIDNNLSAGNYIDNTSGAYEVEWDGFSNMLSIRAPLVQGENTIKIGVADTGDTIYDSGLLINDMGLLSDGAIVGGILNVVDGSDGDEAVGATTLKEEINLGGGTDTVSGTGDELDGDVITGFGSDDSLVVTGATFGIEDVEVTIGSAILDIDTDGDGTADTTVTLEGNFEGATFAVENDGGNSLLSVANPNGTADDDELEGTSGADEINGLGGNDTIRGLGGDDTISGGAGNDRIKAGGGADDVYGDGGRDKLNGQGGADVLMGGGSKDKLKGGGGKDTLDGGSGNDKLIGGKGADVFVFEEGADTVKDFGKGDDKLEILHPALDGSASAQAFLDAYAEQVGEDVVFDFGGGDMLTLQGVMLDDLGASDFL